MVDEAVLKSLNCGTLGLETETRLCANLACRGARGGTLDALEDLEHVLHENEDRKWVVEC